MSRFDHFAGHAQGRAGCVAVSRFDHFAGRAQGFKTDSQWVDGLLATMPAQWQDTIRGRWETVWDFETEQRRRAANLGVLEAVRELSDAQRAGLRLDADDDTIKARAVTFARHYAAGIRGAMATPGPWPRLRALAWALDNLERHGMAEYFRTMAQRVKWRGALERVACDQWWRRVLRRLFAQTVEKCSIGLGLVHKRAACYVSDLSVRRRRNQLQAVRSMAERTELENDLGQRVKLAELIGKSTADKTIRRAELMTRISGFDVIAQDLGHEALFVTVTCPSRMHKWTERAGRMVLNPSYDGTTPGEAQQYLAGQWAKLRATLARGTRSRPPVSLYGFRVVEPHHDGCPHWHLLLFLAPEHAGIAREMFMGYFLRNDSPFERGAAEHRVKFERIDPAKGSAAAYIAKYISKAIDGYQVGEDLFGNPAIESSARIDAWASTWRIRQFQQLGGAPVTVWRELRRLNPDNVPAELVPDTLAEGLRGVNIAETGERHAQGWRAYVMAQGGPCAKRKGMPIRLLKKANGELNRYDQPRPDDVVGVEAAGRSWFKRDDMVAMLGDRAPLLARPAFARIESERAQWRVVGQGSPIQAGGEAARPWTRVNNCTRTEVQTPEGVRHQVLIQRGRLGRYRPRPPAQAAPGGSPASSGAMQ